MQSSYFDALTQYRAGDARPIAELFAQACRFAASSGTELVDALVEQLRQSETLLSSVRKDAAAWRVLPLLVSQPIIDAAYLISALKISKATAERTLDILTNKGIVVERTGGRRNRIWEHKGIIDVLNEYAAGLRRG